MISIGKNVRPLCRYADEVEFCKKNSFDFLQIWFDSKGFGLKEEDPLAAIKDAGFPSIIHALLDINRIIPFTPELLRIVDSLGHKEIIVHPVCKSEAIQEKTIIKLAENMKYPVNEFSRRGVTVLLENNSRLDPIFNRVEEIEYVFSQVPELEFLIDIAHIDSYDHLRKMLQIKRPKALHLADRHMEIVHEHLALGEGNIDFKYIFDEIVKDFQGKVIFEIVDEDKKLMESKRILESMIMNQ